MDHPLYNKVSYEKLYNLPQDVKFPNHLKNKIHYNANKKQLIFEGIMSIKEKKQLLRLSKDELYHKAIKNLFYRSFSDAGLLALLEEAEIKEKDEIEVGEKNYTVEEVLRRFEEKEEEKIEKEARIEEKWKKLRVENFVLWQEVYLRLIKNFENIGDTKSADDAYFYYRKWKPKFKIVENEIVYHGWGKKTLEWAEYIFVGLTFGYGVRPWYSLLPVGLLIVFFTFLYFNLRGSLEFKGAERDFLAEPRHSLSFFDCLSFSIMTFAKVGYEDFRPKGAFKVLAIVEGVLGWIIMALFVVSMAKVWLR